MKKIYPFLLSFMCLSLIGCQTQEESKKTEGELLAEGYNSTSYINMDDIVYHGEGNDLLGASLVSDLAGGINAAVLSLMSLKPDAFAGWATSTLFKMVFKGEEEDKTQKVLDSLSTVEKKVDQINKKLDEVLLILDSLMEKEEINALKNDINVLRSSNAYLKTYIDYTKNLSIGKNLESSLDEETVKTEYAALNARFKDAPTELNSYAHLLFDAGAHSGKNVFYNIKRIVSLNHFLFDYQEVELKLFNDSAYLLPYLYGCAIVYGQLNYIMKTSSPTSMEYIDAKAMFETTKTNAERVNKAFNENKIQMRKEGYISFLYPDNEKYISFYPAIRNISADTYINHNVDVSRLGDKKYWYDWAYAKTNAVEDPKTQLYAVKQETINMISDCIQTLVKTKKMDNMLLSDLFFDAGFEIPTYSGMGEKGFISLLEMIWKFILPMRTPSFKSPRQSRET